MRDDSIGPIGAGTLNGWKDIAGYLGKSVRAVQRWERHFGLPVHRIKTPTGQVVYSFQSEIDAWRTRMDSPTTSGEPVDATTTDSSANPEIDIGAEESVPGPPTPQRRRTTQIRSLLLAGWAVLAIAALGASGFFVYRASAGQLSAERVVVSGRMIQALAANGQIVWSHDVGSTPTALRHSHVAPALPFVQADLDGDGDREVFVVVGRPSQQGEPWNEAIYCFSRSGQLRWIYTPSFTMSFGGTTYDGPWRNYVLHASESAGKQRVWAVYGHHTWWPTNVVELHANGTGSVVYSQAGAIYSLSHWILGARNYLVAGGVSNPFGRASVAVIDLDGGPAASPHDQVPPEYRCDSCASGQLKVFALLPRTEINENGDVAYNQVSTVRLMGSECVIETLENGINGMPGGIVYHLRSDFSFRAPTPNDAYWTLHRRFEREGRISHDAATCPSRRQSVAIRAWTPARGWALTPVEVAGAPAGTLPASSGVSPDTDPHARRGKARKD